MSGLVLAIDQGTTNTKALALDPDGRIVARHSVPTPIAYPRPGWVEQSGDEIWRATTAAIDGCLSALPEPATIAAIGVSNQRETVLLWRRSTGETVGPCVTWQCRRSSDRIDALRTSAIEETVESKTGLGLDPLFPAAKIGWLLEAYPEARSLSDRGDLCAGTIDSWLLFNLTGGANELEQDEEERRAGRGGGGQNPAFATHSFNIRPDVVDTPAGLAVQTTMKSADYRAYPEDVTDKEIEAANEDLRATLEGRSAFFAEGRESTGHSAAPRAAEVEPDPVMASLAATLAG